jgi:hypothetical protein
MVVLNRPLVEAADPDGQPFGHSTKLGLQKKGITDIALLGQCHHLQRLDLSHNNITSAQVSQHPPSAGHVAIVLLLVDRFPNKSTACMEASVQRDAKFFKLASDTRGVAMRCSPVLVLLALVASLDHQLGACPPQAAPLCRLCAAALLSAGSTWPTTPWLTWTGCRTSPHST